MIRSHIILGVAACGGLAWRVHDPIGSYTNLFEAVRWLLQTASASELVAKSVSLVLVDQINGILIGLVLASFAHIMISIVKRAVASIWTGGRKSRSKKDQAFDRKGSLFHHHCPDR